MKYHSHHQRCFPVIVLSIESSQSLVLDQSRNSLNILNQAINVQWVVLFVIDLIDVTQSCLLCMEIPNENIGMLTI